MKNRVAFIVPYFGKLTSYFSLFINSVANKKIDVFFFSDCSFPGELPQNIKIIPKTYNEIKTLYSEKIGFNVALDNPYKLCDLKPTLGLVFQEYISDYEFWGSTDTDLVVGNYDNFINDELLNGIDFYSCIKEYVSGSFFIMRNNFDCNNLFRKSKDLIKVLSTKQYLGFDECGGKYYDQLKAGQSIFDLKPEIQSFTEILFLESRIGLRTLFTNTILEPKGFVYTVIDQKGVIYLNKEYLLIHFIYLKARYYFKIYPAINTSVYYINSLGNFRYKPTPTKVLFSKNMFNGVMKKIEINLKKIKL